MNPDDTQLVENVLDDTSTPRSTRRWILERAAVGAVAASALAPASALARGHKKKGHGHYDSAGTVGTTAVTAEALAVTYLSEVIRRAPGTPVAGAADVIKAANREEYEHYKFLHGAGFKPLTRKFWIPDAFFGDQLSAAAPTIEVAETLFINAYLIGITTFAHAGNPTLARYAGEILGVEAEHRALARNLQGKLPNNLAFEGYKYHSLGNIVKELSKLGVGFGQKSDAPGAFYDFATPAPGLVVNVGNKVPK